MFKLTAHWSYDKILVMLSYKTAMLNVNEKQIISSGTYQSLVPLQCGSVLHDIKYGTAGTQASSKSKFVLTKDKHSYVSHPL